MGVKRVGTFFLIASIIFYDFLNILHEVYRLWITTFCILSSHRDWKDEVYVNNIYVYINYKKWEGRRVSMDYILWCLWWTLME